MKQSIVVYANLYLYDHTIEYGHINPSHLAKFPVSLPVLTDFLTGVLEGLCPKTYYFGWAIICIFPTCPQLLWVSNQLVVHTRFWRINAHRQQGYKKGDIYCHTRPHLKISAQLALSWRMGHEVVLFSYRTTHPATHPPGHPPTHPATRPGGSLHWNNSRSYYPIFLKF